MNVEEKSKDLIELMYYVVGDIPEHNRFYRAESAALKVVDEIIKAIDDLQYERKTDYWENVKQEIEKL